MACIRSLNSVKSPIKEFEGIIVLGMHRSGTSCLTGMLEQSGFFSGEVEHWSPDNEKGSRENSRIVALNDSILQLAGLAWDNPDGKLVASPDHKEERDRILASLKLDSGDRPWLFKDPRTLLTLDFWLEANVRPFLLGIARHPLAVAGSISRRNLMPAADALALWTIYNKLLLKHQACYGFPVVLFEFPDSEFAQKVQRAVESAFEAEVELGLIKVGALAEFIDSTIVHHLEEDRVISVDTLANLGLQGGQARDLIDTWNSLLELVEIQAGLPPRVSKGPGVPRSRPVKSNLDEIDGYLASGSTREALESALKGIDKDSGRADLWLLAINLAQKLGNNDQVASLIREATELHPENMAVQIEQAKDLWQRDARWEAVRLLEKIDKTGPSWVPLTRMLAEWYFTLGVWKNAASKFFDLYTRAGPVVMPSYFAQLFLDYGEGFSEKHSMRKSLHGLRGVEAHEFEFASAGLKPRLRLDPINEFSIVRVQEVRIQSSSGRACSVAALKSNALLEADGMFYFASTDPQLFIKFDGEISKDDTLVMTVRFTVEKVGLNALSACLKQILQDIPGQDYRPMGMSDYLQIRTGQEMGRLDELMETYSVQMERCVQQLLGSIRELEDQRASHQLEFLRAQAEIEQKDNQIVELSSELRAAAELAERQADLLAQLEKELDLQRRKVDERFHETAMLVNMLEDRKAEFKRALGEKDQALADAHAAHLDLQKQFLIVRALHARDQLGVWDKLALRKNQARLVNLIEASPHFDANWYLEHYKDVARHLGFSKKPALHYLLNGGYEGRNPGPGFDSIAYLQRHPEVLEAGVNPLVHYLLHGEAEIRGL